MKRLLLLSAFLALLPHGARAQRLEYVDSLIAAGQYAQARTALADWQRAYPPSVRIETATRARALFLQARLTEDATQAQEHYLRLALTYPTSREAPESLLRLGQGLLAANDHRRAVSYLERLARDYPNAANRADAHLWLARAQLAAGSPVRACETINAAQRAGFASGEIADLIAAEERTACAGVRPNAPPETTPVVTRPTVPVDSPRNTPRTASARSSVPTDTPRTRPQPRATPRRADPPPPAAAATPKPQSTTTGQFAAQAGAFRNVATAEAITARLKRLGFDARVAYLTNGTLALVRVGRFRTRADAVAEGERLKAAKVTTIIVDDVRRERK
jgi:cell division protein FtsN